MAEEKMKPQQDNPFGTSHTAFTADGRRVQTEEETAEDCPSCTDSPNAVERGDPFKYCVTRNNQQTVTLCCPNCGDQKILFFSDVKWRKDSPNWGRPGVR